MKESGGVPLAAAKPAEEPKKDDAKAADGGFKELSNDEVAKMSMPEQLAYTKKLKEWKAN